MKYLITLFLVSITVQTLRAQTYVDYYRSGLVSYEEGDFSNFLRNFEKADSLRPNHRVILYNLAAGYALTNQSEKAYEVLSYRSSFYAIDDFSSDSDFVSIKEEGFLDKVLVKIESKNKLIQSSELAFEIPLEGFHAEGISFNSDNNRFFITDIRNGWIYSISKEGGNPILEFDLKEYGFWSAMGIIFDINDPNKMWVTSSAMPNFISFNDSLEGKSAILLFDLKSKKLLNSFEIEGNHVFGDLVQSSSGAVYFTDSINPSIFGIDIQKGEIVEISKNDSWWSLQGLTLSEDEEDLYFSDYITGIHKLNLTSKISSPISDKNELLRGADGIYRYQNKIYTLHNGTAPKRVASIRLDDNKLGIASSIEFLDNAIPELDEPTLGVIVGSNLYYIFNSPWGYYDRESNPMKDDWKPLRIQKLSLKGF